MVDLTAGTWWVSVDRQSEGDAQPTDTATMVTVTAAPAATPAAILGAVPVAMTEYAFAFPAAVAAGPQIWELTDTGSQPHFVVVAAVPDGTTPSQMTGAVATLLTGTPVAGAVPLEAIHGVYDSAYISSGQHLWIQVDLDPGTYVAVCFVPDKGTGQPHALMGMVQVFTVT